MDFNSNFKSIISSVWNNDEKYNCGGMWIHPIGCQCSGCKVDWMEVLKFTGPTTDFITWLEMPGTKKKDLSIKLKGSILTVKYTTRLGEAKTYTCTISEKFYEVDKLSCSYEDGLLTIKAPLKKEKPPEPPQEPEIEIEIK